MTLTLTQLPLMPWSKDVNADLADVDMMHRRVMSLLPAVASRTSRHDLDTLFRTHNTADGNVNLLIQSNHPLNLARLPQGYAEAARAKPLDVLFNNLKNGSIIKCNVVANPSYSSNIGEFAYIERSQRRGLTGENAHNDWWARKANTAGLTLHENTTIMQSVPAFKGERITTTPNGEPNHTDHIFHKAIYITSHATVYNADALRNAIRRGIGAGKSHGLGLLMVATQH